MSHWNIVDVRAHVVDARSPGGDYHDRAPGHGLVGGTVATPMSRPAEHRETRTSCGIKVPGSIVIEIELADGTIGLATGFGGYAACFLIERHFRQSFVGSDLRDIQRIRALIWLRGLTEALRPTAMAAAYGFGVVPRGSGACSDHFMASQPNFPFCEYLITSPDAGRIEADFGPLFEHERVPQYGTLPLPEMPGFGQNPNHGAIPFCTPYMES